MGEFRRGVRLAIDWGRARVGVAACDPDGLLAHPVETVPNDAGVLDRLDRIVAEYEPFEVLLGMPVDLRGRLGPAAQAMGRVADDLVGRLPVPLRVVDERMSTAAAARKLAAGGRTSRQRRNIIDQAAAVDILEQALEFERLTGRPAGTTWTGEGGELSHEPFPR
ncbi:Holliday junction resolvase RuvX [Brooklawnia cerclae]|uniref:Putative pre-16S rRNA nuclease n=1 Tax=Brooklawnia cerclae TaxID=349934 RepID=A0ABX0SEY9_9ACTN|nr:putative Holliday junction resolvase [Brooklawnia cerclae]